MGVIEDDWDVRPTAGEGRKAQFATAEAWSGCQDLDLRRSAERRETHPVQPAVTLLPLHAAPSAGGGALPPCRAVETTN